MILAINDPIILVCPSETFLFRRNLNILPSVLLFVYLPDREPMTAMVSYWQGSGLSQREYAGWDNRINSPLFSGRYPGIMPIAGSGNNFKFAELNDNAIDPSPMKDLILSGILLSLMLLACKKESETDYASQIIGKWVNTRVNNTPVLTDASFTFEFRSDNIQPFAMGYVLDENNKTWIQNNGYTYSVSGNHITIDGTSVLQHAFHMEFDIVSVGEQSLVYTVSKFLVDNVEYPDPNTYTNRRVSEDLSAWFIGTWYGKSTTPGSADSSYHYWEYLPDGYFNYYYQDDHGNWINKPDNEGVYFLYGNLLATNYTNDLISGGTGKAYECWNISIEGNVMTWSGLRENGKTTSYRMEKVPAPPGIQK